MKGQFGKIAFIFHILGRKVKLNKDKNEKRKEKQILNQVKNKRIMDLNENNLCPSFSFLAKYQTKTGKITSQEDERLELVDKSCSIYIF